MALYESPVFPGQAPLLQISVYRFDTITFQHFRCLELHRYHRNFVMLDDALVYPGPCIHTFGSSLGGSAYMQSLLWKIPLRALGMSLVLRVYT
jgi:hypothetical protein